MSEPKLIVDNRGQEKKVSLSESRPPLSVCGDDYHRTDCRRLDTDSELDRPSVESRNYCRPVEEWLSSLRASIRDNRRGQHRSLPRKVLYSAEYIALNDSYKHTLSCIFDGLDYNSAKDRKRGMGLLKSDIVEVPTNKLKALGIVDFHIKLTDFSLLFGTSCRFYHFVWSEPGFPARYWVIKRFL